jgi:histidinol-phosphate/aromatic aminotransferase/cobyric acid decarboxylase-like protein
VRPADPHPRLERSLRITVGTSADRAVLLNALDEVLP